MEITLNKNDLKENDYIIHLFVQNNQNEITSISALAFCLQALMDARDKVKKNWRMKIMTKMAIKGTEYTMSECETCVHKKVCKIKEQYKKLNEEVTKLDFNAFDDLSNFLISTECKNYLHERYLKSFT